MSKEVKDCFTQLVFAAFFLTYE
jgi:hypothetical protein